MKQLILYAIKGYQRSLSPDHGWFKHAHPNGFCRFSPTCSQYTYEAVDKYGSIKGVVMGMKRIWRCNPWNKGGYDPVP